MEVKHVQGTEIDAQAACEKTVDAAVVAIGKLDWRTAEAKMLTVLARNSNIDPLLKEINAKLLESGSRVVLEKVSEEQCGRMILTDIAVLTPTWFFGRMRLINMLKPAYPKVPQAPKLTSQIDQPQLTNKS